MRSVPARAWCLILVSALLQVLCFPTSGQVSLSRTWLAWVALLPFLLALVGGDRHKQPISLRAGSVLGYLCGVLWYAGNCAWIYQTMYLYGGMAKLFAFLILILFSLYLGLYHALFGFLITVAARSSLRARGALVLAPFAWVAVELLRARMTGFPWDLLGDSQVDNALLTPLAPLAGAMAISFVLAAFNAGCAALGLLPSRRKLPLLGTACFVLVLVVGLSSVLPIKSVSPHAAQIAVMVQENILVGASARGTRPLTLNQEMEEFSRLSLHPERVTRASGSKPTLIIWPEAPSHLQSNDVDVRRGLSALAQSAEAPVVAGTLGVDFSNSVARGYYLYDSASFFDRAGEYRGRYDKIHLVPWGEYIPYKQLFAFAQKLTEGAGDMDPGRVRTIFHADGHAYGVFICYESIFGDEVRQFVREGADVLINISDDGWYGDTGAPWQHLNMARMRAIENHRWILRSTNTGETSAIDPNGNYIDTPRHVRAAYALPFGFEHDLTLYTRFGDWFAYLCAAVTFCALGYSLLRGDPLRADRRKVDELESRVC